MANHLYKTQISNTHPPLLTDGKAEKERKKTPNRNILSTIMINTNKTRKHVGYDTPAAALKQFDGKFHVTLVTVGSSAPSFLHLFHVFFPAPVGLHAGLDLHGKFWLKIFKLHNNNCPSCLHKPPASSRSASQVFGNVEKNHTAALRGTILAKFSP